MNCAVFCDSLKIMCTSNFYSQLFFFFKSLYWKVHTYG